MYLSTTIILSVKFDESNFYLHSVYFALVPYQYVLNIIIKFPAYNPDNDVILVQGCAWLVLFGLSQLFNMNYIHLYLKAIQVISVEPGWFRCRPYRFPAKNIGFFVIILLFFPAFKHFSQLNLIKHTRLQNQFTVLYMNLSPDRSIFVKKESN